MLSPGCLNSRTRESGIRGFGMPAAYITASRTKRNAFSRRWNEGRPYRWRRRVWRTICRSRTSARHHATGGSARWISLPSSRHSTRATVGTASTASMHCSISGSGRRPESPSTIITGRRPRTSSPVPRSTFGSSAKAGTGQPSRSSPTAARTCAIKRSSTRCLRTGEAVPVAGCCGGSIPAQCRAVPSGTTRRRWNGKSTD